MGMKLYENYMEMIWKYVINGKVIYNCFEMLAFVYA